MSAPPQTFVDLFARVGGFRLALDWAREKQGRLMECCPNRSELAYGTNATHSGFGIPSRRNRKLHYRYNINIFAMG